MFKNFQQRILLRISLSLNGPTKFKFAVAPGLKNMIQELRIWSYSLFCVCRIPRRNLIRFFFSWNLFFFLLHPIFYGIDILIRINSSKRRLVLIVIKYGIYYRFEQEGEVVYKVLREELNKIREIAKDDEVFDFKYCSKVIYNLDKTSKTSIEFLRSLLDNPSQKYSRSEIWNLVTTIASAYHENGFYITGEAIEVEGRKLTYRVYENLGLDINESCYFTAIGHMALLDLLIKGKILAKIKTDHLSLYFNHYKVANLTYGKMMASLCEKNGIKVKFGIEISELENDLETYVSSKGTVVSARRNYSKIQEQWESKNLGPLLELPMSIESQARKILKSHGIVIDSGFVGMHLRSGSESARAGRNSNFKNYLLAISEISNHGGWVLKVGGSRVNSKLVGGAKFVDTSRLKLSKVELEVLHTFVWARSRFFIGNLSGGTNPAGTFGVPTLWSDVHPIAHFRPPSRMDIILPRRIVDLKKDRYLTLSETISLENSICQSENPFLCLLYGYQLIENSEIEIMDAVKEMLNLTEEQNKLEIRPIANPCVDKILAQNQLGYGASISRSFLARHTDYLETN